MYNWQKGLIDTGRCCSLYITPFTLMLLSCTRTKTGIKHPHLHHTKLDTCFHIAQINSIDLILCLIESKTQTQLWIYDYDEVIQLKSQ